MAKSLISLSAGKNDTRAFLSLYAAVLLKFNGNSLKHMSGSLPLWYADAKPFLDENPKIAKAFTACYNVISLNKAPKPDHVEKLADLLADKKFLATMDKSVKVDPNQIKLLKMMNRNAHAETQEKIDTSWERVRSNITVLQQPQLNLIFHGNVDKKGNLLTTQGKVTPPPKTVTESASRLATIVKSVSGKSSCFLSVGEEQDLRTSNPKVFEQYGKLKKVVQAFANDETKKLILASGSDHVPVPDLIKKLQSAGVQNNLPVGFTGSFGIVAGKLVAYTKEGLELDRVPMGPTMMNPVYDPKTNDTYVAKPLAQGGPRMEYRTLANKSSNNTGKFAAMYKYMNDSDSFRQKWLKDLMSFDPKAQGRPTREQASAALVECLYQTRHRIGGKGKTGDETTYGLSTVTVGHIKLSDTGMTMNYAGKKSAEQTAKVSFVGTPAAMQLGVVLNALVGERRGSKGTTLAAKKKSDLLFTYPTKSGKDKPILAASISGSPDSKTGAKTYMGAMGLPITAHGFRHETATKMAKEIFAKAKFKPGKATQKEVEAWVAEKLKPVAKALHHSKEKNGERILDTNTALKSYIDPQVTHDFFTRLQLRTPKVVPKVD